MNLLEQNEDQFQEGANVKLGLHQPNVAQLEEQWYADHHDKPSVLENDLDYLGLQVEHENSVREDINQNEVKRRANLYKGTSRSREKSMGIGKSQSDKSKHAFSKAHSHLRTYQKNKVVRKLTNQEKVLIKKRQTFLMKKIIYRLYLRMSHTKRSNMLKWYRQTMRLQIREYLQEFENMNIILSERAFREKLFRTKIKVLQSKIDTKIQYFGALIEEEIKEENMEKFREKVRQERNTQMKQTMAMMNLHDNSKSEKSKGRSRGSKSKGKSRRSKKSNEALLSKQSSSLNVIYEELNKNQDAKDKQ